MTPRPPASPLFPYTTLFRSGLPELAKAHCGARQENLTLTRARHLTYERASPRPFKGRGEARSYVRSEEHTAELQSHVKLVCRPLLEKKNIDAFIRVHAADRH